MSVSLNIDLGELAGELEELYALATVVNIACGGHAGDAESMARAVRLAKASGASIAAHPSYPDRAGFGRTTMPIALDELRRTIEEQCATLQRIARMHAATVRAVKLHGALYHDAARDPAIAKAVLEGALCGLARGIAGESAVSDEGVVRGLGRDVLWVGPARGVWRERVLAAGMPYVREGFADRGVRADGSLVPRGQAGALIEEPERAARQALAIALAGDVETICVHGDTPNAVAIARAVRAALEGAGLLRRNGASDGEGAGERDGASDGGETGEPDGASGADGART